MNEKYRYSIALLFIILMLLAGCPNSFSPFNPEVIDQVKDKNPPVVIITSPTANDTYSQTVTVTGEVTDDGDTLPVLTYRVTDESGLAEKTASIDVIEEIAETGVAGSFSFSFTTSEYSTDILLSVNAADWNGNTGETEILRLLYPGSSLSSFVLLPGNKQVSLSWEPIDTADEYVIYYNALGTTFNESTADSFTISADDYDGSSPVLLTADEHEIKNSVLCRVRVKASSAGGNEWSSQVLETLPLSPYSLLPKTDCFEDKIALYWRPAEGGVTYRVWRSDNGKEGDYELISGTSLTEPQFIDTQVDPGQRYYYRVGTEENNVQMSVPVSAETTSMRTSGAAEIIRTLKTETIKRIAVSGDVAYIAKEIYGSPDGVELIALDISTPSSPTELSRATAYPDPDADSLTVYSIALSATTAYVGIKYSTPTTKYYAIAFDITEPDDIAVLSGGEIQCSYYPWNMEVDTTRSLLYVAQRGSGLGCANISTPSNPGTLQTVTAWPSGDDAMDVDSYGNYAFVVMKNQQTEGQYYGGIQVVNTATITSMTLGDSDFMEEDALTTDPEYDEIFADCWELLAVDTSSDGQFLVMVSMTHSEDSDYYHGGVWKYDISNPGAIVREGALDVGIPLLDVRLDGTDAYCAAENGGVRMINVTNPTGIYQRIAYDTVGDSYNLDLFSSGIVVADGGGGVAVIIPPEIEHPTIIEDNHAASQTYGSFIKDDELYIAGKFGFYSVDVESDGTLENNSFNGDADSRDVVVLGDYAFVAAGVLSENRLAVIDVSEPSDLSDAVFYDCENLPLSVDYWGDYLYLGEGDAGVGVFDIADPENPVYLGLIPVYRNAKMVSAFRDRLYIADYAYGLLAYDIEDPGAPVLINDFYDIASSERQVYSIDVSGDYVYACMEDYVHILPMDTIQQWDTADTSSFDFGSAVGWFEFPKYSNNIQVEGDFLYTVTFGGSLKIYSVQNPENPLKLYDSGSGFFEYTNQYSLEVQGNRLFANNHYRLYPINIMED